MSENAIIKTFDDYRLETLPPAPNLRDRLRLFRGGDEVIVEQRTLEILEQLLSHPPDILIRDDEIALKVWGGAVTGGNVETHICALRKSLKDDAHRPRFIETVRGKGYKFLVPWHQEQRSPYPAAEAQPDAASPREEIAQAFDDFFGDGVSTHRHDGVIIVQSDLMDDLLMGIEPRREITQPSSRLYKAHQWVNEFDVYGGTLIQDEFQRHGMKAPRLILTRHRTEAPNYPSAAFKISMGLGFTDETTRAIQNHICGPWMRISKVSGDAVSLHESLLSAERTDRFQTDKDDTAHFRRLLPVDWDSDYLQAWLAMLPPTNGPEVRDYAMIFRHTRLGLHRQVLFVVAGFTERSTATAAHYLTQNWITLWHRHVQGCAHTGTRGDFMLIIEGPSDLRLADEWTEITGLEITPQKLHAKAIDCDWSRRIDVNR